MPSYILPSTRVVSFTDSLLLVCESLLICEAFACLVKAGYFKSAAGSGGYFLKHQCYVQPFQCLLFSAVDFGGIQFK